MSTWNAIHAERGRLVELLDGLSDEQWRARSLCTDWSVEQVVAHLSAAANTGTFAWLRSIVRAGFNAGTHNDRLLSKFLGDTHTQTLAEYLRSIPLTISPTKMPSPRSPASSRRSRRASPPP